MSNVSVNSSSNYPYQQSLAKAALDCGIFGAAIGAGSNFLRTRKNLKNMEAVFASDEFKQVIEQKPKILTTLKKTLTPENLKSAKFKSSKGINVPKYLEAVKMKSVYKNLKETFAKTTFKEGAKFAGIGLAAGLVSAMISNAIYAKKAKTEANPNLEA